MLNTLIEKWGDEQTLQLDRDREAERKREKDKHDNDSEHMGMPWGTDFTKIKEARVVPHALLNNY